MEPKIVFMGSPDFATPTLQALADNYTVVGAVTQPDRPAGRGRSLTPPPVKSLAEKIGIPVMQPAKLRTDTEAKAKLQTWKPDVIVVAAFGQILRSDVLELAPYGCVNVHASLLPRWRGVSPIQAAILAGDSQTGITIMKMDEGIDTGDILRQRAIPIDPDDTGGSLFEKLAGLGGEFIIDVLPNYLNGKIIPKPQDDSLSTYAPMIQKSDGELDFSQPAELLVRKVRAYNPWPGTFTRWNGNILKIHAAHTSDAQSPSPGTFTTHEDFPAIGTSQGLLVIDQLQPAGKKSISGDVFLRGARDWVP